MTAMNWKTCKETEYMVFRKNGRGYFQLLIGIVVTREIDEMEFRRQT